MDKMVQHCRATEDVCADEGAQDIGPRPGEECTREQHCRGQGRGRRCAHVAWPPWHGLDDLLTQGRGCYHQRRSHYSEADAGGAPHRQDVGRSVKVAGCRGGRRHDDRDGHRGLAAEPGADPAREGHPPHRNIGVLPACRQEVRGDPEEHVHARRPRRPRRPRSTLKLSPTTRTSSRHLPWTPSSRSSTPPPPPTSTCTTSPSSRNWVALSTRPPWWMVSSSRSARATRRGGPARWPTPRSASSSFASRRRRRTSNRTSSCLTTARWIGSSRRSGSTSLPCARRSRPRAATCCSCRSRSCATPSTTYRCTSSLR